MQKDNSGGVEIPVFFRYTPKTGMTDEKRGLLCENGKDMLAEVLEIPVFFRYTPKTGMTDEKRGCCATKPA